MFFAFNEGDGGVGRYWFCDPRRMDTGPAITRPNRSMPPAKAGVGATDIPYIPMAHRFVYRVAIVDRFSKGVRMAGVDFARRRPRQPVHRPTTLCNNRDLRPEPAHRPGHRHGSSPLSKYPAMPRCTRNRLHNMLPAISAPRPISSSQRLANSESRCTSSVRRMPARSAADTIRARRQLLPGRCRTAAPAAPSPQTTPPWP